jgi:hypothetical protein
MCLDDVFDRLAVRVGFVNVLLHIPLWVDDRGVETGTQIIRSL